MTDAGIAESGTIFSVRNCPWKTIGRDFPAALTVAAISLPQGMAHALIADADPRVGLYTTTDGILPRNMAHENSLKGNFM